jgi:DNA-directed RNA polymerase subunit M/transcription elongation factor TFIIS
MDSSVPVSDLKKVTCPNCGASLTYQPGTTSLLCKYCQSTFEIEMQSALVQEAQEEQDLTTELVDHWQAAQSEGQAYVVKCPACGAETAMEQNLFAAECTFCGSPLTVKLNQKAVPNPQAVLPFKLNKQVAQADFTKWLRRLWFAPKDLKKLSASDRFSGVYLPFWTFDAQTETDYKGRRGDNYSESVTQTVNGREETYQITRTNWSPVQGHVSRFFNDILITATQSIPGKFLNALEPWDLKNLEPYDNRFLSGFKAEVSQVAIRAGFNEAKKSMVSVIKPDIKRDIGGDEQSIDYMYVHYRDITYKYILLPVWLSVYRYKDKIYRFVINARTGEVYGERPYSAIKVMLAIIAGLLILVGLLYLFAIGNQ